jgi:hypothetical protein
MGTSDIRAGWYATYRGDDYKVDYHYYGTTAQLTTVDPAPASPGAGWIQERDGRWTRSVPRAELDRMYSVGALALWLARYAVRITSIRDGYAQFEWNPSETGVGQEFGYTGRGPSPDKEPILKRPEGSMAGTDLLSEFFDIRQFVSELPLLPEPQPAPQAPIKRPKRGKPPRLGH